MIAGTNSGCGKTSVVCAVLKALLNKNINPVSFKCGCDYIDPMFHREVIGIDSRNLDSFFCDDNILKYLFSRNSRGEISVVEGVMGFYDGINGKASSYEISQKLNIPVVIVINCKGMSTSIGAVMKGFLEYRKPNNIKGFIFNRLPESLKDYVKSLCTELDTEFFGYFPYCSNAVIESRNLGLSSDMEKINEKLEILGETAEKTIDIQKLLNLSDNMDFPVFDDIDIKKISDIEIAVARDKAFSFIYPDNIDILERLGCKIKYFSPLNDKKLPENISGIILSGGYPEIYAEKLSENKSMISDIKSAYKKNIPIIAECGGFMYLNEYIGKYRGVGIIPAKAFKTERLQRFGYINLKAEKDNIFCKKGEIFPAHEFHYWDSTDCGEDFTAEKLSNGKTWKCIHSGENYYMGFPHIYFYSNPDIAVNFVRKCMKYNENIS